MGSRGSHKACERCHTGRIDKRAGLGLCRQCREIRSRELRQERLGVKARRASRRDEAGAARAAQNGVSVNAEPEPERVTPPVLPVEPVSTNGHVPEPQFTAKGISKQPQAEWKPGQPKLTEGQVSGIIVAYTTTDEPVQAIAARFGVKKTYPYYLLNARGIDWRRGTQETFSQWRAAHPIQHEDEPLDIVDTVPETVEKALENMIVRPPHETRPEELRSTPQPRQDIEAYTPPRAAPDLPTYVNRILPDNDPDAQTWEISYVGKMLVRARSAREALDQAEADGHITQIVGVTLRSR